MMRLHDAAILGMAAALAAIPAPAGAETIRLSAAATPSLQQAIDAATRLFPVVQPEVVIEDAMPLMTPPTPLPAAGDGRSLQVLSALLVFVGALPLLWARGGLRGLQLVHVGRKAWSSR